MNRFRAASGFTAMGFCWQVMVYRRQLMTSLPVDEYRPLMELHKRYSNSFNY